jgi:hypothetical protein
MKTAVVVFPGSNCDYDLYKAIQLIGGEPTFIWHRERGLDGYDAVMLPGGFSYGDYLRAGAIARMDTRVTLAADSRYLGWDILCLGRAASGERFEHGRFDLFCRIDRDGKPLPTVALEGMAEGIVDSRLLQDLERRGGPEAQAYLAKLRASVPLTFWPDGRNRDYSKAYVWDVPDTAVPPVDMVAMRAEVMRLRGDAR